jgi:hypothetical protein
MENFWLSIIAQGVLIIFGIYWVYLSFKMTFAPHQVGIVIDDPSRSFFCQEGQTAVAVYVRLQDGQVIKAKASPCFFCLEKVRHGDAVGVTRFGNHWIVQRSPGRLRWKF